MIRVALVSGGRESTAMVLKQGLDYYQVKIFADTGDDPQGLATVQFLNKYHNWNIVIVRSELGNIYQHYGNVIINDEPEFIGHALPTQATRDCSDKFKIRPINKYLKDAFPGETFEVSLGFSFSSKEVGRMRESNVSYIVHKYPLIERRIDREICGQICLDYMGFVPERSCCDMCFERTFQDWKDFARNNKARMMQLIDFEESSKMFKKYGVGLNAHKSLNSIVRMKVPKGQNTLIECGCFNGVWC